MKSKKNTNKKIFFDIHDVLKHNCLVNMVYGTRGIGKTYSCLKYAIENFKETKMASIYIRRYKDELAGFNTDAEKNILKPLILNDIIKADDLKFKTLKDIHTIYDKKSGKAMLTGLPLSKAVILKSNDFSNVNFIIFDEFIIDKSNYHYIPDEFISFINMIETISRLREITQGVITPVVMLSNSASRNNPYFLNFNIPITNENPYIDDDLLVYKPDPTNFVKEKTKTRWGKFIEKHTGMQKYLFDGEFSNNTYFLFDKLPPKTKYIATLVYLNKKIAVYMDSDYNEMYITDKINKEYKIVFSLTKEDQTPDILQIKNCQKIIDTMKKKYDKGKLKFNNYNLQILFTEILTIFK